MHSSSLCCSSSGPRVRLRGAVLLMLLPARGSMQTSSSGFGARAVERDEVATAGFIRSARIDQCPDAVSPQKSGYELMDSPGMFPTVECRRRALEGRLAGQAVSVTPVLQLPHEHARAHWRLHHPRHIAVSHRTSAPRDRSVQRRRRRATRRTSHVGAAGSRARRAVPSPPTNAHG